MKVLVNGEVYAIRVDGEPVDGSEWFGDQIESLQAQRMKYPKGKDFRVHYHMLNPRTVKRTQEAFVVISGRIAVDIYDRKVGCVGTLEAGPGEAILVYRGGHGVRVLEDCVVYETKAGQFTPMSEEKEFPDV